jgi:hypothetical protein
MSPSSHTDSLHITSDTNCNSRDARMQPTSSSQHSPKTTSGIVVCNRRGEKEERGRENVQASAIVAAV